MNIKKCYVVATIKSWNIKRAKEFIKNNPDSKIFLVRDKNALNYEKMNKIKPRYIFFPHWSWIIPEEIHNNFECIVFHMTDLPFGRGGSPLQNLIVRKIYQTKITAIKVVKALDAGPVYMKKDLSLNGSADEIYRRASQVIFNNMIPYIMRNEPVPNPQEGIVAKFQRRTAKDSRIPEQVDLNGVYDYIRMLDGEGYPAAFIETKNLNLSFTKAIKTRKYIEAKVRISRKENK
ncbi:MAG: methionyl-tRNA formyltransferase [Planctomycetes bacterium]|nr:methionyl-tRNA formyltransferase [Planctomycetota bacterium]